MATPHIDDTVIQGAAYSLELTFTTDAGTEITDLDNMTFKAYLKTAPSDTNYVEEFTIVISGANNEIMTLSLTGEETALLPVGRLYWDLLRYDSDGEVYMVGRIEVIELISDGSEA